MFTVAILFLCASEDFYLPDEKFDSIYFPDERFAIRDWVDERRQLIDVINTTADEDEKREAAEQFGELGRRIDRIHLTVERRRAADRLFKLTAPFRTRPSG